MGFDLVRKATERGFVTGLLVAVVLLVLIVGKVELNRHSLEERGRKATAHAILNHVTTNESNCFVIIGQMQTLRFNPIMASIKNSYFNYSFVDNLGWSDDRIETVIRGDRKWLAGRAFRPECNYLVSFFSLNSAETMLKQNLMSPIEGTPYAFSLDLWPKQIVEE